MAGAAGAAALGLVLGLWAKPDLSEATGEAPIALREATQPRSDPTSPSTPRPELRGAYAPPVVAEAPQVAPSVGLEPTHAASAEAGAVDATARTALEPSGPAPPSSDTKKSLPAAQTPLVALSSPSAKPKVGETRLAIRDRAPPPPAAVPAPDPQGEASNSYCASSSAVETMFCANPELRRADRRLQRALGRALTAGAPRRQLLAEQSDWLSIRDDAAERSYTALANVYEQRIGELNALAEDAYDDDSWRR